MFNLNNKVAVVTGASSGLGKRASLALANEGAQVILLARRVEKLEEIVEEITKKNKKAEAIACDVTNEENIKTVIEKIINKYGKIDILFNNAGVAVRGGVVELTQEDWDKSFNTNAKGIYLVSKYVVPHMIKNKYGKIINTASINAMIADKADTFIRHSYNASKAAVVGLTKGMAASYGKYNITVNAIAPGLFETEMTENTLFKSEEFLAMYSNMVPLSRPAHKEELNGTVLYLASDASSYVTGQLIAVDGGLTIV